MKITVKSKQEILSTTLKEYIHSKIQKLDQFFHNTQEIVVEIHQTSLSDDSERFEANAMILASGTMIHATERAHDSFAVTDMLYEKLRKQLRKHKEKMIDRRNQKVKQNFYPLQREKTDNVKVVLDENSEHFIRKPIDVDEALAQLKELDLSLRKFDAIDPVKYDFALFGLGRYESF